MQKLHQAPKANNGSTFGGNDQIAASKKTADPACDSLNRSGCGGIGLVWLTTCRGLCLLDSASTLRDTWHMSPWLGPKTCVTKISLAAEKNN